jgi:hypothetical protein
VPFGREAPKDLVLQPRGANVAEYAAEEGHLERERGVHAREERLLPLQRHLDSLARLLGIPQETVRNRSCDCPLLQHRRLDRNASPCGPRLRYQLVLAEQRLEHLQVDGDAFDDACCPKHRFLKEALDGD